MTAGIDAERLSMKFGRRRVVDSVGFSIRPGAIVGLLGPNGAGKSTLMRMLTGFLEPEAGSAVICGRDITRDRAGAQALIGYLPEAAAGFGHLTVREFLSSCGEARGLRGRDLREALARTTALLELEPVLTRSLGRLSKGWRQRAWLAQALLHDPPVLILDEPTDGLDPQQKRKVQELLRRLAADKAILLSSHILEEVEESCQRTLILAGGRLLADEPTAALLDARGRLGPAFLQLTAGNAGAGMQSHVPG